MSTNACESRMVSLSPLAYRISRILSSVWRRKGILLACQDALLIIGCFLVSYYIRFYVQSFAVKTVPVFPLLPYVKISVLMALIWIYIMWQSGTYQDDLLNLGTRISAGASVIRGGAYAVGILMGLSFLFRENMLFSRQVYLMSGVLAAGVLVLVRFFLFPQLVRYLARRNCYIHRMVVIGLNELSRFMIRELRTMDSGIDVVGIIARAETRAYDEIPCLGEIQELEQIHRRQPFDVLVLSNCEGSEEACLAEIGRDDMMEVINFCERYSIRFYMLSGPYQVAVSQDEIGSFAGYPIVRLRDASLHPVYSILKRGMDIIGAGAGILLTFPLWVGIMLVIRFTSEGPVFFTQTRAGLNGKPFKMFKFRSMVMDAEKLLCELVDVERLDEPVFKIENDPRVTPIGRFLRRTSLDELPQLINVLKGEMSLVGPRPEEVKVVSRYNVWQQRRLKAKPGITGYQQIRNRGDASLVRRIKYDLIYLKNQSLLLDIYILVTTIFVVVSGKGNTG